MAPPTSTHPTCSCVPGPLSAEAGLIYAQGALLVARSLLTDYLSIIEGRAGRWIIQQVWRFLFSLHAAPAEGKRTVYRLRWMAGGGAQ